MMTLPVVNLHLGEGDFVFHYITARTYTLLPIVDLDEMTLVLALPPLALHLLPFVGFDTPLPQWGEGAGSGTYTGRCRSYYVAYFWTIHLTFILLVSSQVLHTGVLYKEFYLSA